MSELPPGPPPEAIREQLRLILESPGFIRSERLRRFLTHCVEAALAGRLDDLKEYTIALAAFNRPRHFNPAEDPIVRVEARRLRKKLEEYYETQGKADPILIQVPKGAYLPTFEFLPAPAVELPAAVAPVPIEAPVNKRHGMVLIIGAAVLLSTVVALLLWMLNRRTEAAVEPVLTRMTASRGLDTDPALSLDGSLLAYASDREGSGGLDIWIQPARAGADRIELRRLTDDPADDAQPAISPDKSTVAFRSERQPSGIYLVAASGGPARLLVAGGRNPRYSSDGRSLAYWIGSPGGGSLPPAGKAYVIASSGGTAIPVLPGFASAACPVWSGREGRLLLEGIESPASPLDWWSVKPGDPRPERTGLARLLSRAQLEPVYKECSHAWSGDAAVISALRRDTQDLWRVRLSPGGQPQGELAHFTFGSAAETVPSTAGTGLVTFSSRSETIGIWRIPVEHPDSLLRLTEGETTFPSIADHRLAYLAKAAGRTDVWVKDLDSGKQTQITGAPAQPRYPQLCPGREEILYSSGPNAFSATLRDAAPRPLCNDCARIWQCTAQQLVYSPSTQSGRSAIRSFDLERRSTAPLLESSDFDLAGPQMSADGWVVFHAIAGPNRRQIFVTNARGPTPYPQARWIPVTGGTELDRNAVWGEHSDTLYFLSERCGFRCIWTQRLHSATKQPLGPPSALRHFHFARQGLSAIGDVGAIGLTYAAGNLYFAMAETTGDIWVARYEKSAK